MADTQEAAKDMKATMKETNRAPAQKQESSQPAKETSAASKPGASKDSTTKDSKETLAASKPGASKDSTTKDSKETPAASKPAAPKDTAPAKKTTAGVQLKPKDRAVANAYALHISPKQAKYICRMIKGKSPDAALDFLRDVAAGKRPVKMTGREVPHQHGKGIAGAFYPKNAAIAIAAVVQQLKANSVVNGIENPVITLAIANQGHAPLKRGGQQSKRTRLELEAKAKNAREGTR